VDGVTVASKGMQSSMVSTVNPKNSGRVEIAGEPLGRADPWAEACSPSVDEANSLGLDGSMPKPSGANLEHKSSTFEQSQLHPPNLLGDSGLFSGMEEKPTTHGDNDTGAPAAAQLEALEPLINPEQGDLVMALDEGRTHPLLESNTRFADLQRDVQSNLQRLSATDLNPSAQNSRIFCYTKNRYRNRGHARLQVGEKSRTLGRLKLDSDYRYTIDIDSFPTQDDASFALARLQQALTEWQKHINVRFVYVWPGGSTPLHFTLTYRDDVDDEEPGRVYAESFFPGELWRHRNLYIFALSYRPGHKNYMHNIFCHEVGHILGLRHSNAAGEEEGIPSTSFPPGCDNTDSVMTPVYPSMIRISAKDGEHLRELYALEAGTSYNGYTIVDAPW
jgi:hypothetical protein